MNTIFLLSQTYIEQQTLKSSISETAAQLKLDLISSEEEMILSVPNFGDILEIVFESKQNFSTKMGEVYFTEGYGPLFSIWYNNSGKEDTTVVSFLQKFLTVFPDCLVYNDEVLGKPAYVFTKAHFDRYQGNDYYALLFNEPENLETST